MKKVSLAFAALVFSHATFRWVAEETKEAATGPPVMGSCSPAKICAGRTAHPAQSAGPAANVPLALRAEDRAGRRPAD